MHGHEKSSNHWAVETFGRAYDLSDYKQNITENLRAFGLCR